MVDYKTIFESCDSACLIIDPKFVIVAVSNEYLALVSRIREDLIGKYIFDAFPNNPGDLHDGLKSIEKSLNEVIKTGKKHCVPWLKYDISVNGIFEARWWKPTNSPVIVDGKIEFIIHQVEDVTELEALREYRSNSLAQLTALTNKLTA